MQPVLDRGSTGTPIAARPEPLTSLGRLRSNLATLGRPRETQRSKRHDHWWIGHGAPPGRPAYPDDPTVTNLRHRERPWTCHHRGSDGCPLARRSALDTRHSALDTRPQFSQELLRRRHSTVVEIRRSPWGQIRGRRSLAEHPIAVPRSDNGVRPPPRLLGWTLKIQLLTGIGPPCTSFRGEVIPGCGGPTPEGPWSSTALDTAGWCHPAADQRERVIPCHRRSARAGHPISPLPTPGHHRTLHPASVGHHHRRRSAWRCSGKKNHHHCPYT